MSATRLFTLLAGILLPVWIIALIYWPLSRRMVEAPWEPPLNSPAPSVSPRTGVILTPDSAARAFPPCTRSNVPIVLRYWAPSPEQVRQLEVDIAPYLPMWDSTFPWYAERRGRSLHTYYRQYLGLVTLDGIHVIYVNAFHPHELVRRSGVTDSVGWRSSLLDVCDGADGFWNVEYNPRTRLFRGFGFDGSA